MSEATTGQVSTQAAELYDRFFVPALFDQWPGTLLDLAEVRAGDDVVDVGCGTGVLALAALGRGGAVVGVDPNAGMLAVAWRRSSEVTWLEGVAEQLPLDADSASVVASQFALMFFVDRAGAVAEMRRVLRPGGRLVIATWTRVSEIPGYDALAGLLRRVVGDAAAEALLAPFVVGSEGALFDLVSPAFPDVRVETRAGRARFFFFNDTATTEIKAWTLEDMVSDDQLAQLLAEAPAALGQFVAPDGTVDFSLPALIASA